MSRQKAAALFRSASEILRRTVCGVIENTDDHHNLDPDAVVIISLCDITQWGWSELDFPHIPLRYVISNVKLEDWKHFPIPFTLYYNDGDIDKNLSYGIRCDIVNKSDHIIYSSERFISVLTEKHPKTNVHITVSRRSLL